MEMIAWSPASLFVCSLEDRYPPTSLDAVTIQTIDGDRPSDLPGEDVRLDGDVIRPKNLRALLLAGRDLRERPTKGS